MINDPRFVLYSMREEEILEAKMRSTKMVTGLLEGFKHPNSDSNAKATDINMGIISVGCTVILYG